MTDIRFADDESGGNPFELQPFQKVATSFTQYGTASRSDSSQAPKLSCARPPKTNVWYATEKIHGAQLQLYVAVQQPQPSRGLIVRAAKRSGWLSQYDSFFGFQEVLLRLAPSLLALIQDLAASCVNDSLQYVVVYGELFGGWYPADAEAASWKPVGGKDTRKRRSDASVPVQEGVYYSNRKEFAVFDVAAVNSRHERTWLPFHQTLALCDRHDLLRVPTVAEGSQTDVNDVKLTFDSLVPPMLNTRFQLRLAPLPKGSNLAEGVVVRPDASDADALYKGAPVRQLVKHKHAKFAEVEEIERPNDDEPAVVLVERVWNCCATPNRFAAVASKLNDDTSREALAAAVMEDIETDFWEVAPPAYQSAYGCLSEREIDEARARLLRRLIVALSER